MMQDTQHRRVYRDLIQGSDEWLAARCGLLTASEMKLILTPGTLKASSSDKERAYLYELLAQRITQYVEPNFVTDDMMRGHEDEIEARRLYSAQYSEVDSSVGFVTNDRWGFTLGYSPDGIVGLDGLIEVKSRRQKYQVQTLIEHTLNGTAPAEYMLQLQTGLLVTERSWIDFISYSGGLPMTTIRVYPDAKIQAAIIDAAGAFESRLARQLEAFNLASRPEAGRRVIPTERRIVQEMFV
jgi:hypothetical protein